jgi:hypothetical protein
MSDTYISADLRQRVIKGAGNCCEYCRLSQADNTFRFHIDHIIAEKHDGETVIEYLALSCPNCNTYKGSDIASVDRETKQLTFLFNPRTQNWDEHFRLNEATIEALSPEGRITVRLLQLNRIEHIEERLALINLGSYPCKSQNTEKN